MSPDFNQQSERVVKCSSTLLVARVICEQKMICLLVYVTHPSNIRAINEYRRRGEPRENEHDLWFIILLYFAR